MCPYSSLGPSPSIASISFACQAFSSPSLFMSSLNISSALFSLSIYIPTIHRSIFLFISTLASALSSLSTLSSIYHHSLIINAIVLHSDSPPPRAPPTSHSAHSQSRACTSSFSEHVLSHVFPSWGPYILPNCSNRSNASIAPIGRVPSLLSRELPPLY